MSELSDEEFKKLLALYVRAHQTPGVSFEEGRRLRAELLEKLRAIYSANPLPFPFVFNDFRKIITDRFLDTLKKRRPAISATTVLIVFSLKGKKPANRQGRKRESRGERAAFRRISQKARLCTSRRAAQVNPPRR
jgi:hypothetical protein